MNKWTYCCKVCDEPLVTFYNEVSRVQIKMSCKRCSELNAINHGHDERVAHLRIENDDSEQVT